MINPTQDTLWLFSGEKETVDQKRLTLQMLHVTFVLYFRAKTVQIAFIQTYNEYIPCMYINDFGWKLSSGDTDYVHYAPLQFSLNGTEIQGIG